MNWLSKLFWLFKFYGETDIFKFYPEQSKLTINSDHSVSIEEN